MGGGAVTLVAQAGGRPLRAVPERKTPGFESATFENGDSCRLNPDRRLRARPPGSFRTTTVVG
jgi:hypothetical protein